ncbi:MAG: hypothetical protein ACT4O6_21105 [Reyranella sp.]
MVESKGRYALPPRDTAAALGDLIVTWAWAQNFILFALAELMAGRSIKGDDDDALVLASPLVGMAARTHLGLLKTLSQHRLPEVDATKIEKITEKLSDICDHRNDLVHGVWSAHAKPQIMVVATSRVVGKVSTKQKLIIAKQIQVWTAAIRDQMLELVRVLYSHGYLKSYVREDPKPT